MTKFINDAGLRYVLERIKEMIAQAVQVDIVTTIDQNSADTQIPSAKAVSSFVLAAIGDIEKLHIQVVESRPTVGVSNTIYLIEATPGVYSMHLYSNGRWHSLGNMEIDLDGYWAKEDLQALSNTEIQAIVDSVLGV